MFRRMIKQTLKVYVYIANPHLGFAEDHTS